MDHLKIRKSPDINDLLPDIMELNVIWASARDNNPEHKSNHLEAEQHERKNSKTVTDYCMKSHVTTAVSGQIVLHERKFKRISGSKGGGRKLHCLDEA